ncbi:hypothetical protein D7D25_11625 [Proteiniphilum sp. X52]|nr:hypothetical protein D7D25_11625 [Proteiniphilum sp. X52]
MIAGLFFRLPPIAEAYPGFVSGVDKYFGAIHWPVLFILLRLVLGNGYGYAAGSDRSRAGVAGHKALPPARKLRAPHKFIGKLC